MAETYLNVLKSPGERMRAQPWSFVVLALATGLACGILLRYRGARKLLRTYLGVRHLL